jgi:hypothetical protein
MRAGFLGPPLGDEAVAAGASGSPLLGGAADRGATKPGSMSSAMLTTAKQ